MTDEKTTLDTTTLETLVSKLKDFLPDFCIALIVLLVGLLTAKIIVGLIKSGLKKSRIDATIHSFLLSLTKILLDLIAIVVALSVMGVPMASIIAVIGAAGLAVGLALQNSLSNLAGGFIILFAKPFKKGDYISSNGAEGFVDSISILYTRILTADNKAVYIPNGTVSSAQIVNFTQEKLRRVDLTFSIAYDCNFQRAKEIISEVTENNPLALRVPEPTIRVIKQGESSIDIVTRIWVNGEDYWTLYFDMTENVKAAFDENGISIPFNQMDVHIREDGAKKISMN